MMALADRIQQKRAAVPQPTIADKATGEIIEMPHRIERRETGLIIADSTTFEEWAAMGEWLQSAERSLMWWIGDWMRFGERKWGEKYAQALDEFKWGGMDKLRKLAWVARNVPVQNRRLGLTWSHHHAVASAAGIVSSPSTRPTTRRPPSLTPPPRPTPITSAASIAMTPISSGTFRPAQPNNVPPSSHQSASVAAVPPSSDEHRLIGTLRVDSVFAKKTRPPKRPAPSLAAPIAQTR